jgi:hypothetical protein
MEEVRYVYDQSSALQHHHIATVDVMGVETALTGIV